MSWLIPPDSPGRWELRLGGDVRSRCGAAQLIVDLLLKIADERIAAADGRCWWQRHAVAAAVRSGSVAA